MKIQAFDNLYDSSFPDWTTSAEFNNKNEKIESERKYMRGAFLFDIAAIIVIYLAYLILWGFISQLLFSLKCYEAMHYSFLVLNIGGVGIILLITIRDLIYLVRTKRGLYFIKKELNRQGYKYYKKAQEHFLSIFDEKNPRHYVYDESLGLEDPEKLTEYLEKIANETVRKLYQISGGNYSKYDTPCKNERALALHILYTISYLKLMDTTKYFELLSKERNFEEIIDQRVHWLYLLLCSENKIS